ncbi:MAG: hypothetical protein JO234_02495, partial [Hyphomicrobiales bacterium]|nr:hypothetical protein [Hyphomicrobiales bacterium]
HHAVAGAIGGCIVGRHMANQADQKKKQDAAAAAAQHNGQPSQQPAPGQPQQ